MTNIKKILPEKVYYDGLQFILGSDNRMVAEIRGWGYISKLENPEQKQNELGKFIADAINEKLKRDAGIV